MSFQHNAPLPAFKLVFQMEAPKDLSEYFRGIDEEFF
jgi:hypothetical protein